MMYDWRRGTTGVRRANLYYTKLAVFIELCKFLAHQNLAMSGYKKSAIPFGLTLLLCGDVEGYVCIRASSMPSASAIIDSVSMVTL